MNRNNIRNFTKRFNMLKDIYGKSVKYSIAHLPYNTFKNVYKLIENTEENGRRYISYLIIFFKFWSARNSFNLSTKFIKTQSSNSRKF